MTTIPDTPIRSGELAWYVIHVFTGQEEKIKTFLEEEAERLNLKDQITKVLIPREEIVEMREGKKKMKKRTFFPGYMLVEMLLNKTTEHLILNTPQVINFVGPKNKPQPLRRHEVDRILGQAEHAASEQLIELPFGEGDTIKVIDGPFKDFTGTIREINLPKRKVKVMVSIFGRSTPIELDFLQVSTELRT